MFLETKRLILRKFREEDFDDFAAWGVDEDTCRMMGRIPDARFTFDWLKDRERRGYALVDKDSGKVIGNLSVCAVLEQLAQTEPLTGKRGVSLSFAISPEYRRRGLMTEAVEAVIRQLFSEEGIDYIQCGHFVENAASAALQKKLGFTYLTTQYYQAGEHIAASIENVLWR